MNSSSSACCSIPTHGTHTPVCAPDPGGKMSDIHSAMTTPGREQLLVLALLQRLLYLLLYILLVLMIQSFIFALLVWQSPGSQMLVRVQPAPLTEPAPTVITIPTRVCPLLVTRRWRLASRPNRLQSLTLNCPRSAFHEQHVTAHPGGFCSQRVPGHACSWHPNSRTNAC